MKKRFSILSLVIFLVVLISIAFAQKLMSLPEIKEKAARGDAQAQYNLGSMYETGQGVTKDFSQAKLWYEKAAVKGLAQAQFSLGFMYQEGRGVKQDFSQAKLWYEKAAAQGDPRGNLAIGLLKNKKGYSEAQSPAEFTPKSYNKLQIIGSWKFINGKPIIATTELIDINKDGKLIIHLGTMNLDSGGYGLSIQGKCSILDNNQIKLWFPSHFNRSREETLDYSIKNDILILGQGTYKKLK